MISYFGEFRVNWRRLVAAMLGIGTGLWLNAYTTNLFGPKLIEEFGWAKADFALIGVLPLVLIVLLPLAGRLADRYGVRRTAAVGVVALPISYLALSMMNGQFAVFITIAFLQMVVACVTSTAIYSRLIAERFDRARGLAFAIVMSGAPIASAVALPLLGEYIDDHGWRTGYQLLAGICAVGGGLALLLAGRTGARSAAAAEEIRSRVPVREVLRVVSRNPTFWLITGAMFLCNLPQALGTTQLKLVLLDSGVQSATANWMLSGYAIGVIVGRYASGVALDYLPARFVAFVGLGLPAIGLLTVASPVDATWPLALGVAMIGVSQGAEGDVAAYLVSREFDVAEFGFVFSLVNAALSGASALGAVLLSFSLRGNDSYNPFLLFAAATTVVGASLLLFVKQRSR